MTSIADLMKQIKPLDNESVYKPDLPVAPTPMVIQPIQPLVIDTEDNNVDEIINETNETNETELNTNNTIVRPIVTDNTISDFLNDTATDIQSSVTFEDPLEYMERIENMPSLDSLLADLIQMYEPDCEEANEINRAIEKLNTSQGDIGDEFIAVENIMQAIQDSPEYIRYINPANYTLLFNRLTALTEIKVEATKVKSEKLKATKSLNKKAKKFTGLLAGLTIQPLDEEDDDVVVVED